MNCFNYFNFKKFNDSILITNDAGKFCFLNKEEFKQLVTNNLSQESKTFERLSKSLFVSSSHEEIFCTYAKEGIRHFREYLFGSTSLFIFIVTSLCNSKCLYCQAQGQSFRRHGNMSTETAHKALDIVLSSPSNRITIEIQGGEPLINFPIIKDIILYCQAHNIGNKEIQFSLVSNLLLLDDEIITFLMENNVAISTSLDGPRSLHNINRPKVNGLPTFDHVIEKIADIRKRGYHIEAIQTTTRYSLKLYKEIVDTYVQNGLENIFIRPLTPLGLAKATWESVGYTPEEFIEFYRNCLEYILQVNKRGIFLKEGHALIWLKKILKGYSENYMELRSPCGATIGQLAFYFDGNIYTCDEGRMLAEMGDNSFCLGNVINSSYESIVESPATKATCSASILESIPECCDCVYQPYCGTCPVINLANNGDIFPRSSGTYRCKVYRGMLDVIFKILYKNDEEEIAILKSWL